MEGDNHALRHNLEIEALAWGIPSIRASNFQQVFGWAYLYGNGYLYLMF